jgi:hypothetical protein
LQQVPLDLGKAGQRSFAGSTVQPVARFAEQPLAQLPVAVGQTTELPQRDEGPLQVIYGGLDAPLLSGSRGGWGASRKP